ncbi:MAG: response regulator, partial [Cyanobacteria bacterium]|nr:response regulator [Cyanobacteriota bacterium]
MQEVEAMMTKRIEELDAEFQSLLDEFELVLDKDLESIRRSLEELLANRSRSALERLYHLVHKVRGSSGLMHLQEFNAAMAVLEAQTASLVSSDEKLTKDQMHSLKIAFLMSLEFLPERLSGQATVQQLTAFEEADAIVNAEIPTEVPRLAKILIVEDDEVCTKFVKKVLLAMGDTQVFTADTLSGAMAMLDEVDLDLILLDLHLSDSRGLDTYRKITKVSVDVPILILTVETNRQTALEAVASGAQDWLGKNVLNADNLIRCVRYAVVRNHAEQKAARMRAIDDFMSVISHDVKMPLEAMDRLHSYLLDDAFLPIEIRSYVKVLRETNSAVVGRLSRILSLYAIETGGVTRRQMETDFGHLVEQCLNQTLRENKNFEVSREFPTTRIVGMTDPELLQRVLMMVLDNAFKHSFQGSGIQVKVERQRDTVAISISNQGPSIPQVELRRMFKSFSKGSPGKQYVPETGMSMYLCYQLVKLLGGTIIGESKANVTTFAISLPCEP